MKGRKPFNLEMYVESLAWKAFQKSKDPAKSQEDFMQDAHLAILKAVRSWSIDGTAAVDTYCIVSVIRTLKKAVDKGNRRRNINVKINKYRAGSYQHDYFYIRLLDALQSRGNPKAKKLIEVFLTKCDKLQDCSMKQLQKISGMTPAEFRLARTELSQF